MKQPQKPTKKQLREQKRLEKQKQKQLEQQALRQRQRFNADLKNNAVILIVCFFPAFFFRIYALFQFFDYQVYTGELFFPLVRGFLADAAICLAIVILIKKISSQPVVLLIVAAFQSLIYAGNHEHIFYNDANINFFFTGHAMTGEFVLGQILIKGLFIKFVACLGITMGMAWMLKNYIKLNFRPTPPLFNKIAPWFLIPILLAPVVWPLNLATPYWVQQNVFEENLRGLVSGLREQKPERSAQKTINSELKQAFFTPDLTGAPYVTLPQKPVNILLIIVEGMNSQAFADGWLPHVAALARENLWFPEFMTHQRQTNRGLYTLLCGDYPNFRTKEAKADIVSMFGPVHACLPEILAPKGYATVFMQSAGIRFMRKDLFCKQIGFDEIHGNRYFKEAHSRSGWGVDDRTLFEGALQKINALETDDAPWMMTLLTSGSHAPYNVPRSFLQGRSEPTLEDAFRYTDKALADLIDQLDQSGILSQTLVLITADEVGKIKGSDALKELEQSKSLLVAITPNKDTHAVSQTFTQSDLLLGVCDYIGMPEKARLGRSLFRNYTHERDILFANVYTDRIYLLEKAGFFTACGSNFDQSVSYQITGDSFQKAPSRPQSVANMQAVVGYSDYDSRQMDRTIVFQEKNLNLSGSKTILDAHKTSAQIGDTLLWTVRGKAGRKSDSLKLVVRALQPDYAKDPPQPGILFNEEIILAPGKPFSFHYSHQVKRHEPWTWTRVQIRGKPGDDYFIKEVSVRRVGG